jgi:hypothetical protein
MEQKGETGKEKREKTNRLRNGLLSLLFSLFYSSGVCKPTDFVVNLALRAKSMRWNFHGKDKGDTGEIC